MKPSVAGPLDAARTLKSGRVVGTEQALRTLTVVTDRPATWAMVDLETAQTWTSGLDGRLQEADERAMKRLAAITAAKGQGVLAGPPAPNRDQAPDRPNCSLSITTWCPGKWLLVDLEVGEAWSDDLQGGRVRASADRLNDLAAAVAAVAADRQRSRALSGRRGAEAP